MRKSASLVEFMNQKLAEQGEPPHCCPFMQISGDSQSAELQVDPSQVTREMSHLNMLVEPTPRCGAWNRAAAWSTHPSSQYQWCAAHVGQSFASYGPYELPTCFMLQVTRNALHVQTDHVVHWRRCFVLTAPHHPKVGLLTCMSNLPAAVVISWPFQLHVGQMDSTKACRNLQCAGTANGSSASSSQAWRTLHADSAPATEQLQPLPVSQSQLDLESFAASILLDDLQIMGDDSAVKSGMASSTLLGGNSSSADQDMQQAQAPREDGSLCVEAAWAGTQGWGPQLSALAAGEFSVQSPFTGLDGTALGQPLSSPEWQLLRAASVPFTQPLQQPSVDAAPGTSPGVAPPGLLPSWHGRLPVQGATEHMLRTLQGAAWGAPSACQAREPLRVKRRAASRASSRRRALPA